MTSGFRQLIAFALRAGDQLVMALAFDLAAGGLVFGRHWYSLPQLFDVRLKASNLLLFLALMAVWHAIFAALGLYRSRRLTSHRAEITDILGATSLGSMAAVFVMPLMGVEARVLPFLGAFWLLSTSLTMLARLTMRAALRPLRLRGRNLRNLVVVGTNARALRFVDLVESKPTLGYQIKGFVDEEWSGTAAFCATGRKLVAGLANFDSYLRGNVVDEVVIALPVSSYYQEFQRVLNACEEQGVVVHMLPQFFDVEHARLSLQVLEGQPVITLRTGAMDGWPVQVKRGLDLAVALAFLVVVAPVLVVVAALVKLTSPGPVLFVQERVGLHKRPFRLLKFRTMVRDAERQQQALAALNEVSGPVFKIRRDPRVTWLGTFLRRTSIDELPQLINVVLGDMSLVGPRPLPIRDYQAFDADWHRRRFSVRPGITCLWQVAGRNSIPFERWMQLDMQYIDHWSLWLDVKILALTLPAVVTGRGAS